MHREEERELAEALTRPEHVDENAVPERGQDAGAEASSHDEMQRVGRVVAVEDDLALAEGPAAGDREQPTHVVGRQIGEQRPLHARILCNDGDIRNVAAANDGAASGSRPPCMRTTRRSRA